MILWPSAMACGVAELVDLRWDQIDFDHASLHVRRSSRARRHASDPRATNCGPCAGCNASRTQSRRSCSRPSAARRSPRRGSASSWSAPARRPGSASRSILTCCAMPAALRWPTTATIPGAAGLSRPQEHPAHGALHRADRRLALRTFSAPDRRRLAFFKDTPDALTFCAACGDWNSSSVSSVTACSTTKGETDYNHSENIRRGLRRAVDEGKQLGRPRIAPALRRLASRRP